MSIRNNKEFDKISSLINYLLFPIDAVGLKINVFTICGVEWRLLHPCGIKN